MENVCKNLTCTRACSHQSMILKLTIFSHRPYSYEPRTAFSILISSQQTIALSAVGDEACTLKNADLHSSSDVSAGRYFLDSCVYIEGFNFEGLA